MRVTFKRLFIGMVVFGLSASVLHAKPPEHKDKKMNMNKGQGHGQKNVVVKQYDHDENRVIIDPDQTDNEKYKYQKGKYKQKDKYKKMPPGQQKKYSPPDHAPAWGYRRKEYGSKQWHFPGSDVYYREEDKQFIYLENGKWRLGRELPDWINVNWDNSIVLKDADSRLQKVLEQLGIK